MKSRRNGFGGLRSIEVIDSTGIHVTASHGEKLDGQKTGAVVAPEISAVADDGVVVSIRVGDEPAAAVIDVNVHFRVLEERAHDRVLRDQLEIARIDFHDVQGFDLGMIGEHLSPGAGGEPNHEDALGSWMNGA